MDRALLFADQEEQCYPETQAGKSRPQQAGAHRQSGTWSEVGVWSPCLLGHLGYWSPDQQGVGGSSPGEKMLKDAVECGGRRILKHP